MAGHPSSLLAVCSSFPACSSSPSALGYGVRPCSSARLVHACLLAAIGSGPGRRRARSFGTSSCSDQFRTSPSMELLADHRPQSCLGPPVLAKFSLSHAVGRLPAPHANVLCIAAGVRLAACASCIELVRPWRSLPSRSLAPRTVIAMFTSNRSFVVSQTVSWDSTVFGRRLARQGVFHIEA